MMPPYSGHPFYQNTGYNLINGWGEQLENWSTKWNDHGADSTPVTRSLYILRFSVGLAARDVGGIIGRPISIITDFALGVFKCFRLNESIDTKAYHHFRDMLKSICALAFLEIYYVGHLLAFCPIGIAFGLLYALGRGIYELAAPCCCHA